MVMLSDVIFTSNSTQPTPCLAVSFKAASVFSVATPDALRCPMTELPISFKTVN